MLKLSLTTKATAISHLWPLLRDGQAPDGLPALVAFHLHRTHNRTTALTRAGITRDRTLASDLVQGRAALTISDTVFIAEKLAIDVRDLMRPLTPTESEDWAFYRISARNRMIVWDRARDFWHSRRFKDSDAARAIGLTPTSLSDVLLLRSQRILRFEHAVRLGRALEAPLLPSTLIDGLPDGFLARSPR